MVLLIAKFNGNIPAANILNIFETTRIFTKKIYQKNAVLLIHHIDGIVQVFSFFLTIFFFP